MKKEFNFRSNNRQEMLEYITSRVASNKNTLKLLKKFDKIVYNKIYNRVVEKDKYYIQIATNVTIDTFISGVLHSVLDTLCSKGRVEANLIMVDVLYGFVIRTMDEQIAIMLNNNDGSIDTLINRSINAITYTKVGGIYHVHINTYR